MNPNRTTLASVACLVVFVVLALTVDSPVSAPFAPKDLYPSAEDARSHVVRPQASMVFDTMRVGETAWDHMYGPTGGRRVAVDSTGRVHMVWCWMTFQWFGPEFAGVGYNSVLGDSVEHGPEGCHLGSGYSAGMSGADMASVALDSALVHYVGNTVSATAKRSAVYSGDGSCLWTRKILASAGTGPQNNGHVAIRNRPTTATYHVLTRDTGNGLLGYWRSTDGYNWIFEPVDFSDLRSHMIVTSPISNRVAIVFSAAGEIVYYESLNDGIHWGVGLFGLRHSTGIEGSDGSLTAVYDYDDILHIVARVPNEGAGSATFKHWSAVAGIRDVVQASWQHSGLTNDQLDINNPQLAVGIAERLNNLYLVWDQYGTNQSGADTAANGTLNADLFLTISTNGGLTWSPGRNILQSASPGCDGDCFNEKLPSLSPVVDSLIHLNFINDIRTSGYAYNPVYYMRLRTPEPEFVPVIVGLPSQVGPAFLPLEGLDTMVVEIGNSGTADLTFALADTMAWVRFDGGPDGTSGAVHQGSDPVSIRIILDAATLPVGRYEGTIAVTTNDSTVNGTEIPVVMNVSETVRASFNFGSPGGTDCWGWVGPDHTEYAIFGVKAGVAFVNAATYDVVDVVPGPGPCSFNWRDMKTYRHYCYAVSECHGTNAGLMIVDLQYLPDSVHLVGAFNPGPDVTSHNLTIDTAKGFAYLAGQNYGSFRIIDLGNPEAPEELPYVNVPDIHDLYARNDTVWVAEGSNGSFSIWKMTNKYAPQLLTRIGIPNAGYVHNIWASQTGSYVVTTEETPDKTVKVWDTQNLLNVQLLGQYLGPSRLVHNAHIQGNHVVLSHYQSGVKVVDFTDPSNPVAVNGYDTYPEGEEAAFAGCWGVYPHTLSGRVYASNMEGSFFILEFPELLAQDSDGDALPDDIDNCPFGFNPSQSDMDGDGMGDVCDPCPSFASPDKNGCSAHGDVASNDGVLDAIDLSFIIDFIFFQGPQPPRDPGCPHIDRGDVNCDGIDNTQDLAIIIDLVFFGLDAPCNPCACSPYPTSCP